MPRWFRTFLVCAVAFAAWTVACPAFASSAAPFCDGRGATTFAPAPQLQAPLTSVEIGETDSGCRVDDKGGAVERKPPQGPEIPASDFHATPVAVDVFVFASGSSEASSICDSGVLLPGVSLRVERPPRS